eukprot:SAG22_NODE_7881_length_700_cov_1.627288_1_plen_84_part_00
MIDCLLLAGAPEDFLDFCLRGVPGPCWALLGQTVVWSNQQSWYIKNQFYHQHKSPIYGHIHGIPLSFCTAIYRVSDSLGRSNV